MTGKREIADLTRAYFDAYVAKRRDALEEILHQDFAFRCPLGNRVGRDDYFEVCWPGSARIRDVDFESFLTGANEAMVRYEATLTSGATFRCAEYLQAKDGKLVEVAAYFGTHPDKVFSSFQASA